MIGEVIIYLGMLLVLISVITRMFFLLVRKEFKIYEVLIKIAIYLFLIGAVSLATSRILF